MKLTKDFFFGGYAIFTVKNTKTGEHRTYRIEKPEPSLRFPNPAWFIKQMTGTDNERHYSYIGKIDPNTGIVKLTDNSKFAEGSTQLKAARWIVGKIVNGLPIPPEIEINHAGKCGRCGRLLTNPESLETGIGPECSKIMGLR